MDYINRDAAIKLFTFATCDGLGFEPTIHAYEVVDGLKSLPSADVAPVVHGHWIVQDHVCGDPTVGTEDMWIERPAEECDDFAYCSVCGKYALYTEDAKLVLSEFCPSCGAKME